MGTTAAPRAIGIVRVSQPRDRGGPSFSSPEDQRAAIERLCAEQGWRLVTTHDEMHVSGNAVLEARPGLSQAVTAVLTGAADVIVGAYTERLWWSHEVRAQVLRLVQDAGGEVWAVDTGRLSNGSAAEDFTGEVRTSADRFSRRQNAEKSALAQQRAIDRGVPPWPNVTAGYLRSGDGAFVPDPAKRYIVAEAFELRAGGATINDVRAFLAANGIKLSYHGVGSLLSSRVVLGEIHFGAYRPNLSAHTAIVDRDTWERVQRVKVPRGRRAKSDRLLARLGVLRCATCGARMVVGSANHGGYALYRCPPNGDCPQRVTISADRAEAVLTDAVRAALADAEGRASVESSVRDAETALALAQDELDALIRLLDPLEHAAGERLMAATAKRDTARERLEQLGGTRASVKISAGADWERLSLDARRGLIRATVDSAAVAPGRGSDRITVKLFGE